MVAAVLGREVNVLLSDELLQEYRRVLVRPRAGARHGLAPAQIDALLDGFGSIGRILATEVGPPCPDADDQHLWDLLATAPEAGLVTGDKALLRSMDFPGRIVSPREIVERYLEG